MKLFTPPLCIAALGWLCGFAEAQAPRAAVRRDSAGIHIVDHASIKTSVVAFRIDDKVNLDLGGLKSDLRAELDTRAVNHTPRSLSDGRVIVNGYYNVQRFNPQGGLIDLLGRQGQGPGEFNGIGALCVTARDSIIVVGNGRITVFDAAGKLVRAGERVLGINSIMNGCFSDGSLLVQRFGQIAPDAKLASPKIVSDDQMVTLEHVNSKGELIQTLASFPVQASMDIVVNFSLFVQSDTIYGGDGRASDFKVLNASGKIVRIVRWHDPLLPVTENTQRNFAARAGGSAGSTPPPERPDGSVAPTTLPAYGVLQVDPAGRVWIRDHAAARLPRSWTVFARSGDLLGKVAPPHVPLSGSIEIAGFRGPNEVILRWIDNDGARHLSYHSLIRG